jgi:tetratricopeptide (TPR) repeat protein
VVYMALALAAVAGLVCNPAARGQQRPAPPLDPGAVKSRLVVRSVKGEKGPRPVVVLGKPVRVTDMLETRPFYRAEILPREFVRQAVLIAARDELGLSTRDQVIDDTSAEGDDGATAVAEVSSVIRNYRATEQFRRVGKDGVELLLAHPTSLGPGQNLDLGKLLASAEALSREELPGVLKSLGLEGNPNAIKAEGGYPREVEEALGSLGYVDVLLAVREVHRAIRSAGESPERLGALVRGYALLGVLSEHEWHPVHRAFQARSLLYAQRMITREPESPWGLWHRAFAWALVGRHADALADLAEAQQKEPGKKPPETPGWIGLIDAYAHYDSGRLAREEGPKNKLAAFLCMLSLGYPRQTGVGLQSAKDVVALQGDCFRAHDVASEFPGVSTQHMTTMIAPQALEQLLFEKLPGLEGIPAHVKRQLVKGKVPFAAAAIFDKAGAPEVDTGEPAWGALARMIRETRFVHVLRRLFFMKYRWAVPVDEYWNEVRPEIGGHRYSPFLEIMTPAPDAQAKFRQFAERLDLADVETTENEMNRSLWNLGRPRDKAVWNLSTAHEDETADMARTLSSAEDQAQLGIAKKILRFSPFHAYARATCIDKDWDDVKDEVAGWEKESGVSPAVLYALARHYSGAKQYADAERVLLRCIVLSPDLSTYEALADHFKAQGKIDRWQATLEEFLVKVEDLGLDHAHVRVHIAEHYMDLKQWDKARPYADAAATTGAGWAMLCGGSCAEGAGDWPRAEAWHRAVTERYPESDWARWYFFCKRTGHGDLKAARDFVDQYVTARAGRPDLQNEEYTGYFYWLEGRNDAAKAEFTRAFQNRKSISAAIALSNIADDEKDAARRNELLKELVTNYKDKAPKSIEICRIFLETVFAPDGSSRPLDIAAVNQVLESIPEEGRSNAEFFVGWFIKNHGQPSLARKYLMHADRSEHSLSWYSFLAKDALKRMGGK